MTEQEKEKREQVRAMLRKSRPQTRQEQYASNLVDYLTSKLQPYDVPMHILMEIAQFAMTETVLVVHDELTREMRRMKGRPMKMPKEGAADE